MNHQRRNRDQLFPGHVSTLQVTDPELAEVFGSAGTERFDGPAGGQAARRPGNDMRLTGLDEAARARQ